MRRGKRVSGRALRVPTSSVPGAVPFVLWDVFRVSLNVSKGWWRVSFIVSVLSLSAVVAECC